MNEFSSCLKCGSDPAVLDARFCTVCGGEIITSQKARQMGWVMLFLGLFMAGLIVFVVVWILVSNSHFSGDAGAAILGISAGLIVLAMGVVGIVGGILQIKHGRRNKRITEIIARLRSAALVVGRAGRRYRH